MGVTSDRVSRRPVAMSIVAGARAPGVNARDDDGYCYQYLYRPGGNESQPREAMARVSE